MKRVLVIALAAIVAAGASAQAIPGSGLVKGSEKGEAQKLNGAGGTFPLVLYGKWFEDYKNVTKVEVNYQGIGSGAGIKSISDQTIDFGASDAPMTDAQMAGAKGGALLHIPTTMGGVVPTYNLPELAGKAPLKFTPETLAGIYLGDITKWNDPLLVADNPDLKTVDKYIVVVHRSDGSGTTFIWTSYLSKVSDKWAKTVGNNTAVNWPVGLGGKGNDGVAGNVKQTPYSIGYVELAYAIQNKLPASPVKNAAGNFIDANEASVTAAAAGVDLPADMRVMVTNSANPKAFPIAGFTWLLVYQTQTDAAKATAVTRMLWWAEHDGQAYASKLYYSPLPLDAIKKAEALIKSITINGKQALPTSIAK